MEQWWNDTDVGNLRYLEEILSHCRFVSHTSHINWLGIEARASKVRDGRLTAYVISQPLKEKIKLNLP